MASKESEWDCVSMNNEGHDLRLSVTIRNFLDHICVPGEVTESPQMECTRRCGAKWVLEVFVDERSPRNQQDSITVMLKLVSKPNDAGLVSATFKLFIENDGRKINVYGPYQNEGGDLKAGVGVPKFITKKRLEQNKDLYLSNEHLTIRCEGKAFFKTPSQILETEPIPEIDTANILKKMYEESICCDVVLKTGSSEFQCHKNILATFSNYFKAMFGHDMKENRENVVDLSHDLKGDELKAILEFIYLKKRDFSTLSHASLQTLYRVSDMYEINGLQGECEMQLIKQLDPDNARELMVFAIAHCAKRLEKAAAAIIYFQKS